MLDQQQWAILGRYEVVVADDEKAVWEEDEHGKVTHVLLVGFFLLQVHIYLSNCQENDRSPVVASAIPPSFNRRSASLGSHSGSVPHSSSVASGSRASSISSGISFGLDAPESVGGPSKLSRDNKILLLEYLGIDSELPYLGPAGLPSAYQKFKAITAAFTHVMGLGTDDEWKANFPDMHPWIPSITDFINIFVAKSQFYNIWRPTFIRAQEWPDMKDWLNTHPERKPNKELWGHEARKAYSFVDLKAWIAEKDRAEDIRQFEKLDKGKRKASNSPTKLRKKHDDRDQPVHKKKHKKGNSSKDYQAFDESE